MTNIKLGLERFFVEATPKSPRMEFKKGVLSIEGYSKMEDAEEFYKPLLDCIEEYSENPEKLTQVNLKFEYIGCGSSKLLLDVFKKIESIYKSKNEVVVNWYHEEDDESMLEAGEDYAHIIRVPFRFVSYEN
jgi:hypothetical protein